MIRRPARGRGKLFNDVVGRGKIRIAHTEADDVDALVQSLPFHAVDFSEKVGRQALETLGTFDFDRGHHRFLRATFSGRIRKIR